MNVYCNVSVLPWMDVRSVDDSLLEFLEVEWSDGLRVGEFFCKHHGYTDLISVDVRVGGDDRPARKVHTFAHHMLTEQTLLLLENLKEESVTWYCIGLTQLQCCISNITITNCFEKDKNI